MATWQSDEMPAWLAADMERLDREYRYFDGQTKRECPKHGVWRTYEADDCPECGSERARGEVA